MSVGNNIAKFRKEQKLTQEELANLIHVSNKAISSYENNRNLPNIETLILLSEVLEVSINDILGITKDSSKELKSKYEKKDFFKTIGIFLISIIPMLYFLVSEYLVGNTILANYYKNNETLTKEVIDNFVSIIKSTTLYYLVLVAFSVIIYWLLKVKKNKLSLVISLVLLFLGFNDLIGWNFKVLVCPEAPILIIIGLIGLVFSIKCLTTTYQQRS